MIELLGIGVEDGQDTWLLHRVCARIASGQMTAVVSGRAQERRALIDVLAARQVPSEGRAWIDGAPLARDTAHRLRERLVDVDLGTTLAGARSVLWNTLAARAGGRLRTFLRLPRPAARLGAERALSAVGLREMAPAPVASLDADGRLRVVLARALVSAPSVLLLRDPDVVLPSSDALRLMKALRLLSRTERVTIVTSLAGLTLARAFADRLLVIAEGALVFDGPPVAFTSSRATARPGVLIG